MSFRARTRTITPIVPRRRSLSSSRTTPTTSSIYSSNTTTSPYTSRSLASNGYNNYTSPSYSQSSNYGTSYGGSRDNIYNRNGYSSNYGSGPTKTNGYGTTGSSNYSDRYVSPYTSSYDNGIVSASLNLSSKSPYSTNNSSLSRSRNSNLLSASGITGSTPTLNSYATGTASLTAANVGRSNSFREQERKGRSRNRKASAAAAARSMSCSSEKSEGYEVRLCGEGFL